MESWNPIAAHIFWGDFAGGKTIPHQLPGPDGNMAVTFTTDEARHKLLHERSSMEVGEGFDAQLQRFGLLFFYQETHKEILIKTPTKQQTQEICSFSMT